MEGMGPRSGSRSPGFEGRLFGREEAKYFYSGGEPGLEESHQTWRPGGGKPHPGNASE